jgi:LPPG:FO 2-phospho-L-lactate transferase
MTDWPQKSRVIAISGGVGGAKLALGLADCLSPEQLLVVANTADDFTHMGMRICPDLDTVMYNLAGVHNPEQGWGLAGESWNFLDHLKKLGAEDWFALGDKDMATHMARSQWLAQGYSLSEVTRRLCAAYGVAHQIVPMTEQAVSTQVVTPDGELSFQHYFVREACQPTVQRCYFEGINRAMPQREFADTLVDENLGAIIICPSNPFVSVEPVLAIPGVREALKSAAAPVVAVSPIIGGRALKGPAAKMMAELGLPQTATAVAEYYGDVVDGFVLDSVDAGLAEAVEALGQSCLVTSSVMRTREDKQQLARQVLGFASALQR